MSAGVRASQLLPGDRVLLDDGQEVAVRSKPYRHWSGAVVVRVDYVTADGPGRLERRPDDVVRLAAGQEAPR